MKIQSVFDASFGTYGKVHVGFDVKGLMAEMEKTPCPADAVTYVPSVPELEALPIYEEMKNRLYGGMPTQLGYCNGANHLLNALEYHRDSEWNLACTDLILILGREQDVVSNTYDTGKCEIFFVPAGTLYEMYATTLHYAPVSAKPGATFRCVVALPAGTNFPLPFKPAADPESQLITHTNKWLIAHPDAHIEGAFNGLTGANIEI